MAAASQSDSKIFSVRIVSIDHYMSPPIPGVDICYSSFQGGKVNEVPIIRVYGSTPAGQKTCLHVHGAFPYLYVPCSDIPINPNQDGDAYANSVSLALEKALKLKGNAGSKRQHVHRCSLVRARKFYGYHPSEELFVKVYLYYPQDVSRAANLLLGGAVFDKILQPHEAHVPFLLQFLIDYNLCGMGHLHLAKMKFRFPIPDAFIQRQFNHNDRHGQQIYRTACMSADVQTDSSGSESLDFPLWVSSTIPGDWRWEICIEYDTPSDQVNHHIQRQSICELEGDAIVDDILNQQFKMYTSLSQARSDVKMVQSLIPIWEEYERSDMNEAAMPHDPGKPHPEDVLKILSHGLEFERKLNQLYGKSEDKSLPAECKLHSLSSVASFTVERKSVELGDVNSNIISAEPLKGSLETQRGVISRTDDEEIQLSKLIGTQNPKVPDSEALGLLRWLATSQAAEDINSEDELVCETILSPLLPATSIDKVLEKANKDYESESQKECQDIMDSVEDIIDSENFHSKASSVDFSHFPQTSAQKKISLVDDNHSSSKLARNAPKIEMKAECKICSPQQAQQFTGTSSINKNKRKKRLWGSLPFNVAKDLKDPEIVRSSSADLQVVDCKNYGLTAVSAIEDGKVSDALVKSPDIDFGEAGPFVGCSIRDLMRIKRSRLVAPQDSCYVGVEKDHSGEQETENILLPKGFDLHARPVTEHDKAPLGCIELRPCITSLKTTVLEGNPPSVFNSACASQAKYYENKSTHICRTSKQELHEFPSEDLVGVDTSAKTALLQNEKCFAKKEGISGLCRLGSSLSKAVNMEGKTVDTIGMTFCKKPPIADWNVVSKPVSCPTALSFHSFLVNGDNNTGGTSGHILDELLPFFEMECPEKDGSENASMPNSDFNVQLENFVGVPTHYLNDGSPLYLLTPAFSPPSSVSVSTWLLNSKKGSYEIGSQISSPLGSDKVLTEPEAALHPMPQQKLKGDQNEGNIATPNARLDCLVDASQISGPDGRSRPTPLSQIGFRDPASVGAGQQLTILSIEVHAESRADLRPDPRFDAINVLAVAFQNDNDPATEVYVLLRSDTDSYKRSFDGISSQKVLLCSEEKQLFSHFIRIVGSYDPDILMGWDIQGGSLGFLGERAAHLGIGLLNSISRTPLKSNTGNGETENVAMGDLNTLLNESLIDDSVMTADAVIEDEWGRTHASGIHVGGRIVLNIWRLMRGEIKLHMYTAEAVGEAVLRRKIPSIPYKILTKWFLSGPGRARYKCIEYVVQRAKLNLEIMNQLDMINRTSELARIFGIDFFSVLSRGSQYRVESMLLRLAHSQNYVAISPGNQQVASQPAMECIPLVMEPESGFYADPVVVLDFQSLYPSMIIAYNLCFCTCLGNVVPSKMNTLGVSSFSLDARIFWDLKDKMLVSPNGVMYVPSQVREGILSRLLEEILSTRIMVKQAMKKLAPSQHVLRRIFNARQLALKLIANVTYGYTAAGFSGRMPCAELADSIVQCGRSTLEKAISLVNANDKWNAKVIYGDTDSMFVLLKGRNVKESFQIGNEIASAVTAMNPNPVTLKLEKVYHPCFLLTKKRYVGYSYESADQIEPVFDAKGIETVRRDTCGAVAKMMEQSLRLFFEHQDLLEVKAYLQRQWSRILSGRVSLQDFVFAKEVRLGTYSARTSSSLPPAAIVATKAMRVDPCAEPRYAERVPYVVIHGEPGARLVDMVVDPLDLLAVDSPYRLNDLYYINKQIIPALQRVFGLLGADLKQWFGEMPRPTREGFAKHPLYSSNPQRTRIDFYYLSKHCVLCGELVNASEHICNKCSQKETNAATALVGRTAKLEKDMHHLAAICRHCGGGDWLVESGVKCTSLACSVFYERRKVQKELKGLSAVVADKGLYPRCMAEWF